VSSKGEPRGRACYHPRVPPRSRSRVFPAVVLVLVLVVVGSVSYVGWRQSVAGVQVTPTVPKVLGHTTPFGVAVQATRGHVVAAEVRVVQGGKPTVVARHTGPGAPRVELPVALQPAAAGLKEGAATVEVWAHDDFWRPLRVDGRALLSVPVTIDLTPPRLELVSATQYLYQGGSGVVVFRAPDASRVVVTVGGATAPAFALGPPERGVRVALLALPWDLPLGTAISVTAADEAGNTVTRGVPAELRARRFPRDTIEIRDAFLSAKLPELLPQHPPQRPLLEGFLVVNRELRRQAEEHKRALGAKTADRPLWQGAFLQPRNTKVFSNFAEARTYVYQGREVDTQIHFGFDLASTRQAPVPAANAGAVVFAGPLTIYGNTVVVDHGLGLQTLYAHLSSLEVKAGDRVTRGQELGRSGATGLALGDHLHYEVLVHGVSVTPVEWWDGRWIRDRLARPLAAAGLADLIGVDAPADDAPAAAPRRSR
jgi:murein DD-endopeptidase MepM/ murein hydrolase activator NlpD